MTKRTNRSRGGLSPSRGPGRGLPAQTQVYSRPSVAPESMTSPGSCTPCSAAPGQGRSISDPPAALPPASSLSPGPAEVNSNETAITQMSKLGGDDHPRPDDCNGLPASRAQPPTALLSSGDAAAVVRPACTQRRISRRAGRASCFARQARMSPRRVTRPVAPTRSGPG